MSGIARVAIFPLASIGPGSSLLQVREERLIAVPWNLAVTFWERHPAVVGQTVRLGSEPASVVGVMPQGFTFPVSHDVWIPLRLNFGEFKERQGPEINVFGRLASGAGIEKARAELTTIGARLSTEFPETHEHIRTEVLPYAQSITGIGGPQAAVLLSINLFLIMLLVLVCGNVARLMFARAATRESKIIVT